MIKNKISKALLVPVMVVAGLGAGIAGIASAQTATATASGSSATAVTSTTGSAPAARPQMDPSKGGHVGQNGTVETLLIGDTATKATAAALAAVPGGTIQRVETDAEGAAYEAHMLKSDGSPVTVKMDSSFNVTGTETGPGQPHSQTQ